MLVDAQHGLGRRDRDGGAAGPSQRDGRRHPHASARASSRRRSRCQTAARSTSRSASTSRPTGATSAAAGSSRARASPRSARAKRRRHAARARRGAEHARRESQVSRPAGEGRPTCAPAAQETPGAFVAVLEKRGRFLVARAAVRRARGAGVARGVRPARVDAPARARRAWPRGAQPPQATWCSSARRIRALGGARVVRVIGRPDVARDVIEALLLDRGASRGLRCGRAAMRRARARDRSLQRAHEKSPRSAEGSARARDVHDRPDHGARLRRCDLCRAKRRWHDAPVGAHRRRRRARAASGRCWTARRAGAPRASMCRARSSRCCPTRSPTMRARCLPARSAQRSRWSSQLRGAKRPAHRVSSLAHPLGRAARLRARRSDLRWPRGRAPSPGASRCARLGRSPTRSQTQRERAGALVARLRGARVRVRRPGKRQRDPRARADGGPPPDRASDDRRQRGSCELLAKRGLPCLYRVHERPDRERIEHLVDQLASLRVPTPPLPEPLSSSQAAELLGPISQARATTTCAVPARAGSRSARSCCARSSRPTTRP